MASQVILENEYDTDLTDIDENAIPVLNETVELDDYLDLELGSNIDLAVDEYEFMGVAPSAISPPVAINRPITVESLAAGHHAPAIAAGPAEDEALPGSLASAAREKPENCEGVVAERTLEEHPLAETAIAEIRAAVPTINETADPDESIPLLTGALLAEPVPQFITAAHASVALLNNPPHSTVVETALSDDDSIEIDSALFAHADAIQSPAKVTRNIVTPSLQTQKKENPFLPQHILDRLQGSGRNLVEEIAQSSAALEACTALLRTRAATDRLLSSATRLAAEDQSLVRKQKLVDELVEDYLPLIAAELRRRLHKMLDE